MVENSRKLECVESDTFYITLLSIGMLKI